MSPLPQRVVKVGGSLLDLPQLDVALCAWLERQAPARTVLVAGGGVWVEAVRAAQQRHHFPDEDAHWLSVRAMTVTARLLARVVRATLCATSLAESAARLAGERLVVLDPEAFLREEECHLPGPRLPACWDTTSDSIAARLAAALGACELVLLKSRLPTATTRYGTAQEGYVDGFFPRAARPLATVRCVDLRDAAWPERVLD